MPYTPVELRHVKLGRALFGFNRNETDRLLVEVADSFEDVWRERGELTDRVEELEKRLEELRQREALLANTLVAAEKAASEAKEAAKREAELIVAEAHGEARSVLRTAQAERERLFGEARRVESLLRSALGLVAESRSVEPSPPLEQPVVEPGQQAAAAPAAPAPAAPAPPVSGPPAPAAAVPALPPAPEHWPKRSDTREFAVVRVVEDKPQDEAPHRDEQAPPLLPEPPAASARELAWGD